MADNGMPVISEKKPVIGKEQLRLAAQTLSDYKAAKQNLDARVKVDEDFWRLLQQQHYAREAPPDVRNLLEPKSSSAWLFNSVINKHADMMDSFPEPNVLPREQTDEPTAKMLSSILPVILERTDFEETYSESGWEKLKKGTGIYGVFWDNSLSQGLGDVHVKALDVLNVFFEPGVTDIQDSKNLFIVSLWDKDTLLETYPDVKDLERSIIGTTVKPEEYQTEVQDTKKDKIEVVDWYYKRSYGGHPILHYVQFVNDCIIFASENDPQYIQRGYLDHGEYPLVFDPLFPNEGSPAGFGYIDIMRSPQEYIDKLDQAILKNALWAAKPRYFVSDTTNINLEEFSDTNSDFIGVAGSLDDTRIRPIEIPSLPGYCLDVRQTKIDELKETSGNRDFSQGTTSAGVTAASAIAALQEAGNKVSRDLNRGSYRAFVKVCYQVIELVRQFYTEERSFRIVGEDMREEFVRFDNSALQPEPVAFEYGIEVQGRMPVFDIKVRAAKNTPFSRLSQNELALQLYGAGFFNPEIADQALAAIDMMDFEGKDKVRDKIQENGTLRDQVAQLQAIVAQMAPLFTQATGGSRVEQALAAQGITQPVGAAMPGQAEMPQEEQETTGNTMVDNAKKRAREGAEIK